MMLSTIFSFPLLPELSLLAMTCVILIADLYLPAQRKVWVFGLSLFSLVLACCLLAATQTLSWPVLGGHFMQDGLAVMLKFLGFLGTALVFIYAYPYLKRAQIPLGEYYCLALFSLLGLCVLVSSGTMLSLYLGLELLSLPLYALVAMMRHYENSSEASIKYFVMGALASGMLLFGISLVYGATKSLGLDGLQIYIMQADKPNLLLMLGLVFMVIGVAFKFGAAPFHLWVPDVYAGSLSPVVLLIGTVPKLAAFGMMVRILWDQFGGVPYAWADYLMIMGVLSLVIGNLAAVAQTHLKRMLGYSAIGHVGFICLAAYVNDFSAGLFYVVSYVLMSLAALGLLTVFSSSVKELETLEDLRGLDKQHRWLALMIMLTFISLAGIPPTIGFYSKLVVLGALISQGAYVLAALALITSVIAAFYYLRVIWLMYFEAPAEQRIIVLPTYASSVLGVNVVLLWVLGLVPGGLMWLCIKVFA